jgi:hypothetical protein
MRVVVDLVSTTMGPITATPTVEMVTTIMAMATLLVRFDHTMMPAIESPLPTKKV